MANRHGQAALIEAYSFLQSGVHGHLKIDADSTEYLSKDLAKQEKKRRIRTWISKIFGYCRHWLHRINDLYHMSKQGNYGKWNKIRDTVARVGFSLRKKPRPCWNEDRITSSLEIDYSNEFVTDASIDKPSAQSSLKRHLWVKGTRKRKVKALCHEEKHSDKKAMERSFPGRKSFKVTLANSKSEKKQPACDSVATKYAGFAVLNKEDNILEVSHITPQRAPVACSRKKLLILDVNGLLADIVHPPPKECKSDTNILRRAIFKRPFCYDFLKFCFERFDVGIWSSRTKKIIDRVVDYLFGDLKYKLLFCWDLSHCTGTGFKTVENKHKELVFKELRKLWEKDDTDLPWEKGDYNESNTLLLDDSPYKALMNPMHTGIFPYSYNFKDSYDTSLGAGGDIRVYLGELSAADDVPNYVKKHPFGQRAIDQTSTSWEYYHKVISSRSPREML